ncbi:MAG: MFS transporter [Acidimicrobiia bacterium]
MQIRRAHDPEADNATDAIVDGDRALQRGTAGAALRHRDFRLVWGGTFLSNIGTWMQNVILGVFAYRISGHDAGYVGLLYFAQLGPLLFLSQIGGVVADMVDRRRYLVTMQTMQMLLSFVLAGLAVIDPPNQTSIFLCVLAIGIFNALNAPAMGAILPTLVPREDLSGAVSLQSVQMNLSRVIGSAIGGALYAVLGIGWVFSINAATYAFAVAGLVLARYDARNPNPVEGKPLEKVLSGARIAWNDLLLRRIFITMFTFSFFSLMYVGLFPDVAQVNFGISENQKLTYGLLYGVWALGASLGALMVGTFLAHHSKAVITRWSLALFGVLLAVFALMRSVSLAFVVAPGLGFAYFLVITSLSTVLQEHLDDEVRGRIMALWVMSFGGTVPIGVALGGWLISGLGMTITEVMIGGAVIAVLLAWFCDLIVVGAPAPAGRMNHRDH